MHFSTAHMCFSQSQVFFIISLRPVHLYYEPILAFVTLIFK